MRCRDSRIILSLAIVKAKRFLRRELPQLGRHGRPVQSGQEVFAPIPREGGGCDRLLQQVTVVLLLYEKQIHFRNRYRVVLPRNSLEGISHLDPSFLFDGKVKSTMPASQESLQNVIPLKLGGQFITGNAR